MPQIIKMLLVVLLVGIVLGEEDMLSSDRNTRDAIPSVPAVLLDSPIDSPTYIPVILDNAEPLLNPVSPLPPPPAPVVAPHPPVPAPYSPEPHTPTLTRAKCSIEEVVLPAEVCQPGIKKDCKKVKVVSKALVTKDDCFKIIKTVCSQESEIVPNEVCKYEYDMEMEETDAQTAEINYDLKCEKAEVPGSCSGYGYGYCKNDKTNLCYNKPTVSPAVEKVKVGFPVPRRVCNDKQEVSLPTVVCDDVEEEVCFPTTYTEEVEEEFEKCSTELGKPVCEETILELPKQVCIEEIYPEYVPPKPAYAPPQPSYTPGYAPPSPAYGQPAPRAYAG